MKPWCILVIGMLVVGSGGLRLPGQERADGRAIYVSPDASDAGDGSIERPFTLGAVLARRATLARPGDTVFLRGGTYLGPFASYLTGEKGRPIVVRAYAGERVTIDGVRAPASATLVIRGAWTIFQDLEITNSNPDRIGDVSSRGIGVDIFGANTTLANSVVHDTLTGVGFWSTAVDAALYGNVVYNNGVDGTDRGHGHSVYVQNGNGTKRLADNVLFNSFSYGIHAYTQGGSIDNLVMDGNVSFNHGSLSAVSGGKSDILLGGRRVAHNAVITNNFTYRPLDQAGWTAEIGYVLPCSRATIEGNYFVGTQALSLVCHGTSFANNTLYGILHAPLAPRDAQNAHYQTKPSGAWVFVRPNRMEPRRATIIIYNWEAQREVAVPVPADAAALRPGDAYEVLDVQNLFGEPVVKGRYSGKPIFVPMNDLNVAQPAGNPPVPARHTAPAFGVFILRRVDLS